MAEPNLHPASFRDPSGFIFQLNGKIYRQVNKYYADDYNLLMDSGLYQLLAKKNKLIPHTETVDAIANKDEWYKTLEPVHIPFVSYPYEWCFEQLRDAALLTLSVTIHALEYGMILKDATPYNVQFLEGKPLFIDTLSFEKYDPAKPWAAYRQFCNMFLFPLYLEHYLKSDIQKIMSAYLEGIPVNITAKLLPLKSGLNLGVWLHVYLQNTLTYTSGNKKAGQAFSKKKLVNLLNHLESTIINLNYRTGRSEWTNYYDETILGKEYLAEKEKIFSDLISGLNADTALDLGANDGYFSKILAGKKISVVATDSDSRTVSKLYSEVSRAGIRNILPLVIDVANPSPAIGFRNNERAAFHERIKTRLVIALALIHHLVISRNLSLVSLAAYFADISQILIIEWIPKDDEKIKQMLSGRKDIFNDYTNEKFEEYFSLHFNFLKKNILAGTGRVIYLMEKR